MDTLHYSIQNNITIWLFEEINMSSLLNNNEETVCKKIARQNDLNGKRAKALLALHAGTTQAEAGNQSGLTPGQVKYIVSQFREKNLSIFPADFVNENESTINIKYSESKKSKKQKKGEKNVGKKKNKKKDKKKDKLKKSKKSKKKNKKGKKGKKK